VTITAPGLERLLPCPDRGDAVRDQTVCFAVHSDRRFGAWRLHQAEDFPGAFVKPVLQVVDAMRRLDIEIPFVCAGYRIGRQARHAFVNIHEEGHQYSSSKWMHRSLADNRQFDKAFLIQAIKNDRRLFRSRFAPGPRAIR